MRFTGISQSEYIALAAKTLSIYRIVLASPSDVSEERRIVRDLVDEINELHLRERGVLLELYRWETDAYPTFHVDGPQGHIDTILRIQDADIFVGIFWKRFGTPGKDRKTGTEHEIRLAFDAWKLNQRPKIMIYFKDQAYLCKSQKETEQWGKVISFRNKTPNEGFWWTYTESGESSFDKIFRRHLARTVSSILNPRIHGIAPSSAGGERAIVEFTNNTGLDLKIFWVDENSVLRQPREFRPKEVVRAHSYVGHVFLVEAPDGKSSAFRVKSPNEKIAVDGVE